MTAIIKHKNSHQKLVQIKLELTMRALTVAELAKVLNLTPRRTRFYIRYLREDMNTVHVAEVRTEKARGEKCLAYRWGAPPPVMNEMIEELEDEVATAVAVAAEKRERRRALRVTSKFEGRRDWLVTAFFGEPKNGHTVQPKE